MADRRFETPAQVVARQGRQADSNWSTLLRRLTGLIQVLFFINTPAANDDVSSDTPTFEDWPVANTETITVPVWATRAVVTTHIHYVFAVTADTNHNVRLNFKGVAGTTRRYRAVLADAGEGNSQHFTWQDEFTGLTAGSAVVKTEGTRLSGTGAWRVTTTSTCTLKVEFYPS